VVKESTIALGLTALGVAFTGIIAFTLIRQGPTPGVAQIRQPRVIEAPLYATDSESQLATVQWTDAHRKQAAMFGGTTGFGDASSGGQDQNPRRGGLSMIGGLQGFNDAASGGQTQHIEPGNPLYTGTRYGPLMGLSAGPRFRNDGPVPIY